MEEAEGAGGTRLNRYTSDGIRVGGTNLSKQARRDALCVSEVINIDDSTGDTQVQVQAAERIPESVDKQGQDPTAREPTSAPQADAQLLQGELG